jgi:hypothetical protein
MSRGKNKKFQMETKGAAANGIPNLDPGFMLPPRLQGINRSIYTVSYLIFAAARAISRQFVSAETEFVSLADKKTPVVVRESDDVAMLFEQPNSIHDGSEFWELLALFGICHGGYIVAMFRNGSLITGSEVPDTLIPFPLGGWTRIVPDQSRPNAYQTMGWEHRSMGLKLENDQCIVKQGPDPSGKFALIAPAEVVHDAAMTQSLLDNFTQSLLQNSGRPGMVITTEGNVNKDDRSRFLNSWNAMFAGTYNAGKTTLLEGAKWELHPITPMSISDIASPTFFQESVRKTSMTFGVPELELGIVENVNRASAGVIRAKFLTDTVFPAFRSEERTWRRQFFKRFRLTYFLRFSEYSLPAFVDLMDTRAETVGKLIANAVPRNEAFQMCGLRVKPEPWGEQAYLPNNLQPADPAQREKERPTPTSLNVHNNLGPGEKPPKNEEPAAKPPKGEDDEGPKPPKSKPGNGIKATKGAMMALVEFEIKAYKKIASEAWESCVVPFEGTITDGTTKWAKRWKGHFLKRLNYFLKTGRHLDENSREAKDLSIVIEWKESDDPHLPDTTDLDRMMPDHGVVVHDLGMKWRAVFGDVMQASQAQMEKEIGSVSSWTSLPPEQHRSVALSRLGDAIKVDETIRSQLKTVLRREMDRKPMPKPSQIAQALRMESAATFKDAFARAATIARTEVSSVMSDTRAAVAKAEGCDEKGWSTAKDGCVRETHRDAEAEGFIPVGQKFKSNLMDRPHAPEGSAKEVCNCRCVAMYRRGKVKPT